MKVYLINIQKICEGVPRVRIQGQRHVLVDLVGTWNMWSWISPQLASEGSTDHFQKREPILRSIRGHLWAKTTSISYFEPRSNISTCKPKNQRSCLGIHARFKHPVEQMSTCETKLNPEPVFSEDAFVYHLLQDGISLDLWQLNHWEKGNNTKSAIHVDITNVLRNVFGAKLNRSPCGV